VTTLQLTLEHTYNSVVFGVLTRVFVVPGGKRKLSKQFDRDDVGKSLEIDRGKS